MSDTLAHRLWAGTLDDPTAPGRDLARRIAGGSGYPQALADLRVLARHGLPESGALAEARRRWPQSIDLARVALDLAADADAALSDLAAVVQAQNRRLSVLARALWARGRCDEARAVLEGIDPASDSQDEDAATRAELAVLSDAPLPPLAGPKGAHLSLIADWRLGGARVLARRYDLERAGFPAHPPLWSWLVETLMTEGDHARARHAMGEFAARCVGAADVDPVRIRLALEGENPRRARKLLDALPDRDSPWRWGPRRHLQTLRCLADEIAQTDHPDYTPFRDGTGAAIRLYPGHAGLQSLHLLARELTEPRAELARALVTGPGDPRLRAATLMRLGRHAEALALLDTALPGPPDDALRLRIRRAELRLGLGDLAGARDALGDRPAAAAPAADHAYWAAEIALAARDLGTAERALAPALETFPSRMGLILTAARARFLADDAPGAQALLDRFRTLKTAQIDRDPPDDLRDRIVRDAQVAGVTVDRSVARAARALALSPPAFQPVSEARIPRRIAHYWEGPRTAAIEDGLAAWAEFPQTVHDAASARLWLADHAPGLGGPFDRLSQAAARADLFRIALMAVEGGIFADLDERPRASVAPWLDKARAVLVIEQGHGTIANNFLAGEPGLALFAQARDRIVSRLAQVETPYPWWDCGPAQMTLALWPHRAEAGLRLLSQADYDARVATNLPYPHKRGPGHWR